MKVVFYNIRKSADKLSRLVKCAKEHFESQKALLFLVPDKKSELFLDQLLWQNAAFLPHAAAEEASSELLVISQKKELLHLAKHIFNLTFEPLSVNEKEVQVIYEFDDGSDLKKKQLSKKKFIFYHQLKIPIEAKS
ncbi:MAG: DNA polymerase III subunit chi [Parachlamydiales bacterium]|jgi:DNA polymerase IIIc chi subunit